MSITAISAMSGSNLVHTPFAPVQQQQQAAKASHRAAAGDSVTFSSKALQLASDGDSALQEVQEGAAEKASETIRAKS
jgi:hypothetical protein